LVSRSRLPVVLAVGCWLAATGQVLADGQGSSGTVGPKARSGMYISIREGLLRDHVFPSPIEGLQRLGVDAIELSLGRDFGVRALDSNEQVFLRTDDEVRAFHQRVEQLAIRICAVMTACDFSAGDMESNIAWIARAVEVADLLGASVVRIDSAMSKEKELDFETRVKLFVEGLGGALNRTSGSNVTLGIENHGFQGNNLAFLLNVFHQVGSDRLGFTLDLCNFYWRGYPLSEVYGILRILAPYAKHAHVKSIHYPAEKREVTREAGWEYEKYACPLDEGDIDLAKVVDMLAKAGYKGDLCIEDESLGKCTSSAERAAILERDVAHVRRILEGIH
jgi:sugar phosphate isomerase/epimerase